MAMAQKTISGHLMIQANWDHAEPLVKESLKMPHHIRTEIMQQHQRKWEDTIWRLDLPEEERDQMNYKRKS
jgi:hypothetical protein